MNDNATRSVNLTMLMIVSVCLPMIGAFDQPVDMELNDGADRKETPPTPCQGYDACRGTDAGENTSSAMDLSSDFAFGGEETNIYWGNFSATTYVSGTDTGEDHNDVYLIDMPVGYGFTVTIDWNYTGNSSYDSSAYAIGIGPADGSMTWIAWGGSGSWGRSYSSSTGTIGMSTDGVQTGDGFTYWYDWPGAGGTPAEIMGEPMLAWVWCYRCYDSAVADDYQMNITVWPSDGGIRGDVNEPTGLPLLEMPDEPFSWTYQSDSFDLAAGTQADVVITSCDTWCTAESTVDITRPDGTVDSFNLVNGQTGEIINYTSPGTYLVEKFDSWGDGGFGLEVTSYIGVLTGILTVSNVVFEDQTSGHVDTNDNSDVYAIWIPENSFANLTLHWDDSSIDLDLEVFTDMDPSTGALTGEFDHAWVNQPEVIELGQRGPGQIIFAEVIHYSGATGAGYLLEYQTIPGELPPCSNQDDGASPDSAVYDGSGSDASEGSFSPDDVATDVGGIIGSDGTGEFTGMLCDALDIADWFQITVPASHGLYASLEWHEGIDTNFNDTIEIEANLLMTFYYENANGYLQFMGSGSLSSNPQGHATNGTQGYNDLANVSTVVMMKIDLASLTSDYELNYTVTLSTYDQSVEPYESMYQNDACEVFIPDNCGNGFDAGDDQLAGTDSLNLSTMNQTFTGWGHDYWDKWDVYRIYLPTNYALGVTVTYPAENQINAQLNYYSGSFMSFIDSSADNPAELVALYNRGGQDLFLRIQHTRGGGDYEVSIEMWTSGMEPGGSQDDCGLAITGAPNGDAADSVYPGVWDGHTFLNGSSEDTSSDAGDFSTVDENGTLRSYWDGGTCEGWMDGQYDNFDMYSIAVPEGHYVEVNYDLYTDGVDANDDGDSWTIYMLMCQQQHRPCGAGAPYTFNGAYFVEQDTGFNLDEVNQISGLWPVGNLHNASGCDTPEPNSVCATNFSSPQSYNFDSDGDGVGDTDSDDNGNNTYVGINSAEWNAQNAVDDTAGWVYLYLYSWPIEDHTYELNITFHDLDGLEGGDQDDANSGRDAGPGASSAVHVNDHLEQDQLDLLTNNDTLTWDGWNHGTIDTTDRFTIDVPGFNGFFITLDRGYDTDVWMILDVYRIDGTSLALVWANQGQQTFNYSALGEERNPDGTPMDYQIAIGIRNWGSLDSIGVDYNVSVEFYTLDSDGDGWLDSEEALCGPDLDGDGYPDGTDPYDNNSVPNDQDNDGICDEQDDDIDGDGVDNGLDDSPLDENVSADMDGDGIPDATDLDMDNDTWSNNAEVVCLGYTSGAEADQSWVPADLDGDGLCDANQFSETDDDDADLYIDSDSDNDGTPNDLDAFPWDACADTDTDGDHSPDDVSSDCTWINGSDTDTDLTTTNLTVDLDDDNDGHADDYEVSCESDPLDVTNVPLDSTQPPNGVCDKLDPDDDGDGWIDAIDWAPYDASEWADVDGDGQGDNRDMDDDNDGYWDSCDLAAWQAAQGASQVEGINYFTANADNGGIASNCPENTDAFPLDDTEWLDTDGDGIGNNADTDDDGQGTPAEVPASMEDWTDAEEIACGSDPLDSTSTPVDSDGDFICDVVDDDDDNDGTTDGMDSFPFDAVEDTDQDGDGIGDIADTDDDDDGWTDLEEITCLSDPMDSFSVPLDWDGDHTCDINDADDDNDGVDDSDDAFPNNPLENADQDDDGIGDIADDDDDNDEWLDVTEVVCAARGGSGDKDSASETPKDSDYNLGPDGEPGTGDESAAPDGLCDAMDPDRDGDGFPNPADPNNPTGDEDRFPDDHTEWYDANGDGEGDNANPVTLLDNVEADPGPYVGILAGIGGLGYLVVEMSRRAGGKGVAGALTGDEDFTEEFEDFDFEDEEGQED